MLRYCTSCKKQVELVTDSASGKSVCAYCGADIFIPPVDRLRKGTVISGFMIEDKLGQGGMGVVYKAKQLNLERYVALKVLSDELASDTEFVERFFKEARAAASLSHANIVQVYDAGSTLDGIYYFAMELVEGETLDTRITRDGILPQKEALEIAIKIASALDYAWEKQSLCHGDIKPDNIILNSSGGAKLADLGLAKSIRDESDFKDGIMATPLYAPPEIISGDTHRIDCRSDMYSFGATLFHMLSGIPPFSGDDPETVMNKHLNDKPATLSEINRELNPAISNLVDHLLLKNPESRPASWKEVCNSLDKIHDVERKVFHIATKPAQSQTAFLPGKQPVPEPLVKILTALVAIAVILVVSTIAAYIYSNSGKTGNDSPVHKTPRTLPVSPASMENYQREWLKVKAEIAKTDPETGIGLIQEYVKNYPSNIPADADRLLQELKQKLISRQKTREDAKMRNEAFRKNVIDLLALISSSSLESTEKARLEEFSRRIEQYLNMPAKDPEISIPAESKDSLSQASGKISGILLKMKAEEESKAIAEQARIENEKLEQEKKRRAEEEKKRQEKLASNKLLDEYYLLLGDFISSYQKKKEPSCLGNLVGAWFSGNKNSSIPESISAKCDFMLNTVVQNEPLVFSILEKNEAALHGKNIPGNISALKITDEYLVEKISDKSIKLMTIMGKGKIGKSIPLEQISPDLISLLLQQRILNPDSGVKLSPQDFNIILAFYLLNGMGTQFAECLKAASAVLSPREKKSWESAAEDLKLAHGERKAIELWREFSKLYNEGNTQEASRVLAALSTECGKTDMYARYADEINRRTDIMWAYSPELQALSLLAKAVEDMKGKQYLAALHKIMTADARCGNMKDLRQSLREQISSGRKLCLDELAANSRIKNISDNGIPFYYWEAETPGDAWIFEQVVRNGGKINNERILSTMEIGSSLDYGNWNRAREIMNSGKFMPADRLTSLKGNLGFWAPSFIFSQGLVNMNYNDWGAQSNSLSALQAAVEHFRGNPMGPMESLSAELAIEYALMLHVPIRANDIAASYRYSTQPADREVRIALLHILGTLEKSDAGHEEFSRLLKKYSDQFRQYQEFGADFMWCRTAAWILEENRSMDLKLLQNLRNSKCSAPDISARIMVSAMAKSCSTKGKGFNSANELIPVIESSVSGNLVSGELWRKVALLKMSRNMPAAPLVIDSLMKDSRICAIGFYPKLCIIKAGYEVMSGKSQPGIAAKNLRVLLDSSTIASDSDKRCIDAIVSDRPMDIVSGLISENKQVAALWCGIAGIMAHKKEPAVISALYKILEENYSFFSWDERVLLEVLIR